MHPSHPYEADNQVEGGEARLSASKLIRMPSGAEVDEAVRPDGEKAMGEATALVGVLGAHRFDEADFS